MRGKIVITINQMREDLNEPIWELRQGCKIRVRVKMSFSQIYVFKVGLALRTLLSGDGSTHHDINYFNRPLDMHDGCGNHWFTPL